MGFVTRHTAIALPSGQHDEFTAWMRSIGLDPINYAPEVAIGRDADGWTLHLREVQHHPDGSPIVDYARNETASLPRVIPLGPNPSWPNWLNPATAWGPCPADRSRPGTAGDPGREPAPAINRPE